MKNHIVTVILFLLPALTLWAFVFRFLPFCLRITRCQNHRDGYVCPVCRRLPRGRE